MTPESLVDIVLEWIGEQPGKAATDRAVIAELGPPLIGWAMAQHFKPPDEEDSPRPTARHGSPLTRLRDKFGRAIAPLPDQTHSDREQRARNSPAQLLAICMQVNAARAFVPVARELRRLGVDTQFLIERGDSATIELLGRESFAMFASASLRDPRVLRGIGLGAARLQSLWAPSPVGDLLSRLSLPQTRAATRSLKVRLRKSILGGLFRAETARLALRELPAKNVLFITRRALFNSLLQETHAGAKHFFYLQGIVPDVPPVRTELNVQAAFAGGPIDLPYLLRCKIPESRICLNGYPDYDAFGKLEKSSCRTAYAEARRLETERRWILFTSQYPTELFSDAARLRNLSVIFEVARSRPELQFIIKLHPRSESFSGSDLPPNVLLETNYRTPELIKAADIAVTYWSTTAIEALLLRTPLVQLNATGLLDFLPLPQALGVPVARSAADLASLLEESTAKVRCPTDRALQQFLGPAPDGYAAARTARALCERLGR